MIFLCYTRSACVVCSSGFLLGLAGCSFAVKQALAQWLLLAILRFTQKQPCCTRWQGQESNAYIA